LDFSNPQYEFNEEDLQSDNYTHHLSKSKHGFILKHTGLVLDEESEQQKETFDSVALAVSIFVNGKRTSLSNVMRIFMLPSLGRSSLWIRLSPSR
jgi:hypothetical protein